MIEPRILKLMLPALVLFSPAPAVAALAFDQERYAVSFCLALKAGATIKTATEVALDDSFIPGATVPDSQRILRRDMRIERTFQLCPDLIHRAPME